MPNKNKSTPDLHSKYQQVIGSLLYIMLGTQPDIVACVTHTSLMRAVMCGDQVFVGMGDALLG
jgi:hypothetical protein